MLYEEYLQIPEDRRLEQANAHKRDKPRHVPVLMIQSIDGRSRVTRLLFPKTYLVENVLHYMRKENPVGFSESLYLYAGPRLLRQTDMVGDIFDRFCDRDGALHLQL